MPAIPVENREEYEAMVKKMNGHFNKMDARETSYADRMTEAASAFTAVQMMIVCANSAGFQSMKGEAPEKIFSLSSTIIRQATLAARILSFKEEVSAAAAKKDHGPQQAPA
jgi:hypothetical protein